MNYYERYMGDYQRDTGHLSLAEHGAYTVLLDTYYSTEQPLPADSERLFRLCRAMTKPEQAAVLAVADQFFPIAEDGLRHNARADHEIAKARPKMDAARANGRRGGRPKKNPTETNQKPTGFPERNPTETETEPSGKAPQPQHHKTLTETNVSVVASDSAGDQTDGAADKPSAAERLPSSCPIQEIVALYHDELPMLPRVRVVTAARAAHIRQRWREIEAQGKAPTREAGLAWWRKFFSYVGRSDFLTGRVPTVGDRAPFLADLEWLTKAGNFAKVIEGRYENREVEA